jgi:hypothetical protein
MPIVACAVFAGCIMILLSSCLPMYRKLNLACVRAVAVSQQGSAVGSIVNSSQVTTWETAACRAGSTKNRFARADAVK